MEHVVRSKTELCKLHGVLGNAVNQFIGIVKTILCTRSNQPHGIVAVDAEAVHHGLCSTGGLGNVILKCVIEHDSRFRNTGKIGVVHVAKILPDKCK